MSTTFVHLILIVCLSTFMRGIIFVNAWGKKPETCRCVLRGTCLSDTTMNFDIKIVNEDSGGPGNDCPDGTIWCCEEENDVTDPICGIRKYTKTRPQLDGTARYAAYPWQVAFVTLQKVYFGSGVLINDKYVLTVAHKTLRYSIRSWRVWAGVWNPNAWAPYPRYIMAPGKITVHPNYTPSSQKNDIALIRLTKPVPMAISPHINCAPIAYAVPAAGTRCWVTGWGATSFPSKKWKLVSYMKEVNVPIIDQQICENQMQRTKLGQFFTLDKISFMCAGGEVGKDACTEGGSPLVCEASSGRWEVVGLVSWGIGCASTVPGIYVNVPNYRNWIFDQISSKINNEKKKIGNKIFRKVVLRNETIDVNS